MTEANIPLIRKVLEYIEASPMQWYQGSWSAPWRGRERVARKYVGVESSEAAACGSTACFAGHTVLLSGRAVLRVSEYSLWPEFYDTADGTRMPPAEVAFVAQEELGLTDQQASDLFLHCQVRSTEALRATVEAIVGEKL